MDLDDWEIIHEDDDMFMDFDDDDDDGLIPWEKPFQASKRKQHQPMFQPKVFIDMNYLENFNDPMKKLSKGLTDESPVEVNGFRAQITIDSVKIGSFGSEKGKISLVSLEETNGNQFADMKLDSPKSLNSGINPGIDPGMGRFEAVCDGFDGEDGVKDVVALVDEERVSLSTVAFECMKENQFVDMKSESLVLENEGFSPRIDVGMDRFEENGGDLDGEHEGMVKGEEKVIQVLFRSNLKETESVELKSESPLFKKRGFSPQIDVGTDTFEEKGVDEYVLEQDVKLKDEERFSQVLFKNMENEFADMKLESPTSKNMGFFPLNNVNLDGFEEEDDDYSAESVDEEKGTNESAEEENNWSLNALKKWGMSGFGAICTFGFAAATIGMIFLSSGQKENHQNPIPKLHYQVYSDHDKRMKHIMLRAKEFNEAISTVRGTHIARAHITVGGYFEGF
ncbi:hypothetical protein Droror1_Dr00016520 [Drosera rotundifolia]